MAILSYLISRMDSKKYIYCKGRSKADISEADLDIIFRLVLRIEAEELEKQGLSEMFKIETGKIVSTKVLFEWYRRFVEYDKVSFLRFFSSFLSFFSSNRCVEQMIHHRFLKLQKHHQ
jgi:hypothetical protein